MNAAPSTPETEPHAGAFVRRYVWLVPLVVAMVEVLGSATVHSRIPEDGELRQAAEFVRARFRDGDQILSAPGWIEPRVRLALGDRISLSMAGAIDLDRYTRVWVVSARGRRAAGVPSRPPELARSFGHVRVERWDLGPSPVLYDLGENVLSAEVVLVEHGAERPCPVVDAPVQQGGLGTGPIWPSRRHVCDAARPWLWVAPTVNEDLDLRLRRCVWQHPNGREPMRATFHDVPLGDRVVLDADIYAEHERDELRGPFEVRVLVDGRTAGLLVHRDGEGRKRIVASTTTPGGDPHRRGTIAIETTAADPGLRTVCWSAVVEAGPSREVVP
ncbi:MAG: hypothetical protein U0230_23685 [Polyangiales bacterium]